MVATHGPLSPRRNFHEPDDSRVRLRPDDRQLSEILIERDEHSILGIRAPEKLFIAGVLGPVADVNDIVSSRREIFPGFFPDAVIEKELHTAASTTGGSTRSCATTLWA